MIAPYGSWPSPVSAETVAAASVAYDAVAISERAVCWVESRPNEGGRNVIVRWTPEEGCIDLLPPLYSVGTRVHEYGGGAYLVSGSTLWFANEADQRLYRIDRTRRPRPITPEATTPAGSRYADGRLTPDGRHLVCVRERHESGDVINELVMVPADGSDEPWLLAGGRDFYSFPRPSPDGRHLAWTAWDHPLMPWDGTELWVAELCSDGALGPARLVAGGARESVFQPEWGPDGRLYFISDRSGWWNLYRDRRGHIDAVMPVEAELGVAQWEFDYSTYAFLDDGRIACLLQRGCRHELVLIEPGSGRTERLRLPFTSIKPYLRGDGRRLALIGSSPTQAPTAAVLDVGSGRLRELSGAARSVAVHVIATPSRVQFRTDDGHLAEALYYRPANPDVAAPNGERPPLIVRAHPGPTANATARLDLHVQFFTSRGFAVADVDYGGSTGYGRPYRERLVGQWGVIDADDCAAAARHLAAAGEVDGARIAICGASAGGYTALRAAIRHPIFAAVVSWFGIVDLEAWQRQTHKFQAHQLHRLVGPWPEAADEYRARSPLHGSDRLSCPVLLLQGLEDHVVPPAQTTALVAALQQGGIPHRYLAFDGEGHGVRKPDNLRRALEAELALYQRAFRLA
ncbi:MAG: S9 family peptidase [Egibacteraceae bacterium]